MGNKLLTLFVPESTTTPPKKDDKSILKEEGSEEEQTSPGLQEGWDVKMVTLNSHMLCGFRSGELDLHILMCAHAGWS